ncbi:Peptidoglycan/LPS O-acetylase OafA/YrhL, contains acyltransferase and SGNH-hydrolase domains [Rhodoferax sp. OV413]|uniref:acyltransferase family protein n=1 Tax=Rhodoferax sp. OV413 TaxID=1855285 RepID=UPI00088D40BD|nr:acyltransferase [Rhodoferax sp. OV413]SDP79306.1 Peptidoglycan/LPS O-acetylase OafA/YrhL, contains acyltransferase and SGNH-hydrolase domains [Rhodoferax sp. OV413]
MKPYKHAEVVSAIELPPKTSKSFLPNLDGIRAIACLLVVLTHIPFSINTEVMGAIGVGIFFTLSGLLMSHLYAREPWSAPAVIKYGVARFSRIAPIYWLVISTCIIISYAQPDTYFSMRIHGATQIARHYLFGGSASIFWSIPPEIQYYIFFIFIWWSIAKTSKLPYAFPFMALLCAALIVTHAHWPGLALPNKLHLFLAGSIAGFAPRVEWNGVAQRRALFALQLGAIFMLAMPLWLFATKEEFYGAPELGLTIALAVYLLSIPSQWTTFIFASPIMRKIGQASFSIYLMHVLVFHYGTLLLGLSHDQYDPLWLLLGLAGVVLPMIASKYIEIPLQNKMRKALEKIFKFPTKKPIIQPLQT